LQAIYVKPYIILNFKYNLDLISKIKNELEGRRWNSAEKYWTIPPSFDNIQKIQEMGFNLDETLKKFIESKKPKGEVTITKIKGLKHQLYPFQHEAVEQIEKFNGRILVAYTMGTGKTVIAAAWMQHHRNDGKFIVVCPASLKYNWEREIRKWTTFSNIEVLHGSPNGQLPPNNTEIFILNYDILEKWKEVLLSYKPIGIIGDEIQYCKQLKAGKDSNGKQKYVKRTKNFLDIGKECQYVIGLSGTPILNRPREIYNFVNLANPYLFPKEFNFLMRYASGKRNRWGWDFSGASNLEELHNKLKESVMIRKTKEEVLPFLPDKTISVIPVEIDNQKEYDLAEQDLATWLLKNKGIEAATKAGRAQVLASITILKQIAAKGKINAAVEFINNILANDEKVVVFCHHKAIVVLTGDTNLKDRQNIVDKFQSDQNCQVFIGTTLAGGIGITLTAANNLVFLEFEWNPAVHNQGEDRIYRIGQDKNVNIYYLTGIHTIDEDIMKMLDNKQEVVSATIDGIEKDKAFKLQKILNNILKRGEKK